MTDRSPSPGEKKDEDLGARGDDSQYQRPLATASKNEPGPTKAQESCGYCLYGPPALCTCGECITDDDDAYGDPDDVCVHGIGFDQHCEDCE